MQTAQTNLFDRSDTFFGVCEGLGQDFGIHPNLLRLAFAGLLFVNPLAAAIAYPAAGAVVALTRWLYPAPSPASQPTSATLAEEPEVNQAEEKADRHPLPLAA